MTENNTEIFLKKDQNRAKSESKLHATWNHQFQLRVNLPSRYSPNKQTQQVSEIAYMIPQKKKFTIGEEFLQLKVFNSTVK